MGFYTMADNLYINDFLREVFPPVAAADFYRDIFPVGSLQARGAERDGMYNAIALELLPEEKGKANCKRYILNDDLKQIEKIITTDNFVIISPISYVGKKRESKNARNIYAIAIDLDGIEHEYQIANLYNQMFFVKRIPIATYIVYSGGGVHLYWLLDEPIPCYDSLVKKVYELKKGLTKLIWHDTITVLYDKPQIQSLFQGFRMVGTKTKGGHTTIAYKTGQKVSIKYLNEFVKDEYKVKDTKLTSTYSLQEAQEKFPEWYQKVVVNGDTTRKYWDISGKVKGKNPFALYDWWKEKINEEAQEGHRFYCIMVLAIYAKKCGVDRNKLEEDAFSFIDKLEKLTVREDNHFTRADILAALEMYNDNYHTFPIKSIVDITNIKIDKNKRNGLPQEEHMDYMRDIKASKKRRGRMKPEGRPSKGYIVEEWRKENPTGRKIDCIEETGLSKGTVYKYWNGGAKDE